jgi:hypothetical protein
VPDDGNAVHAKQWNTAMLLIIQLFHNGTHTASGNQRNKFVCETFFSESCELGFEERRNAFAKLQQNVPDKPITHNDVNSPLQNVSPFHVPEEVKLALFQQCKCFERYFVSFAVLFPDAEKSDAWIFLAEHCFYVYRSHHAELKQMTRFAVDIRSRINKKAWRFRRWNERSHCRSRNAFNSSKNQGRSREHRARMSGADERVGFPFAVKTTTNSNRRIFLGLHRRSCAVVEFNHFTRIHNCVRALLERFCRRMLLQLLLNAFFLANKQQRKSATCFR